MRRSRESGDRADGRISDSFSGQGHCRLGVCAVALTVSIVTYLRDEPKLIVKLASRRRLSIPRAFLSLNTPTASWEWSWSRQSQCRYWATDPASPTRGGGSRNSPPYAVIGVQEVFWKRGNHSSGIQSTWLVCSRTKSIFGSCEERGRVQFRMPSFSESRQLLSLPGLIQRRPRVLLACAFNSCSFQAKWILPTNDSRLISEST